MVVEAVAVAVMEGVGGGARTVQLKRTPVPVAKTKEVGMATAM